MVDLAVFEACAMNYLLTIEHVQDLSANDWRELALLMVYRLSAYAVLNLIDDAAMLSLVFV